MIYDLHSHTNFSDGLLDPTELIDRAITMGVDTLAKQIMILSRPLNTSIYKIINQLKLFQG